MVAAGAVLTLSGDSSGERSDNNLPDVALPDPQPLDGREFPMLRGEEVVAVLDDGTSLEVLREGILLTIYAILDNRKIKFGNPTPEQLDRIYQQTSFVDLQRLALALIVEDTIALQSLDEEDESQILDRIINSRGPLPFFRVLLEGQLDECPDFRYRRGMGVDFNTFSVKGTECVWDEWDNYCLQMVGRSRESSTFVKWDSFLDFDEKELDDPIVLSPQNVEMSLPTSQEWLGTQPDCPDPNGTVAQYTLIDGEIVRID